MPEAASKNGGYSYSAANASNASFSVSVEFNTKARIKSMTTKELSEELEYMMESEASSGRPLSRFDREMARDVADEYVRRQLVNEGKGARDNIANGTDKVIVNKGYIGEVYSNNNMIPVVKDGRKVTRSDGSVVRRPNPRIAEVMYAAAHYREWFPRMSTTGVEKGRDHDYKFKVFKGKYNGRNIEAKTKMTDNQYLYNFRFTK